MSDRATSLRSHTLDELLTLAPGTPVRLCGFHAGRLNDVEADFTLTDRFGACRIMVDPSLPMVRKATRAVAVESAVAVVGKVKGPAGDDPGTPVVVAEEVQVLGAAAWWPLKVREAGFDEGALEGRLRHRHLDLRRPVMQERLALRGAARGEILRHLSARGFLEVDLPSLGPWEPDAAGTFVVPSRQHRAYGLVRTAQLYKELLMMGGCDRIFALTRNFRDEGTYGPLHQPEYTTLDIEQSWIDERDLYETVDGLMRHLWSALLGEALPPIPRLTHAKALERYGTERPDLRFALPIVDVTELCRRSRSKVLQTLLADQSSPGPTVRAIRVPAADAAAFDDALFTEIADLLGERPGFRVTWLKLKDTTHLEGPLADAFEVHLAEDLSERMEAEAGDVLVLLLAPHVDAGIAVAGQIRAFLGPRLGLIRPGDHALCWIHEIPFYAFHLEGRCFVPNRHIMTRPMDEDLPLLDQVLAVARIQDEKEQSRQKVTADADPAGGQIHRLLHDYGQPGFEARRALRSLGVELVLDGAEVGTGSLRNHDSAVQYKIVELLSADPRELPAAIRPVIAAQDAGAPPHGGLGIGFDRLVAALAGVADVREVIPFPKDGAGQCLAAWAPGRIPREHLRVLLGSEPRPIDSQPTEEHFVPVWGSGADLDAASVEVAFSFEPSPAYVGEPVSFYDRTESMVPIVDRVWSCPRIKWRSTERNPQRRFSAPGEYPITLTVFLADGRKASARATVIISRGRPPRRPLR